MNAERAFIDEDGDDLEMLDGETSAAFMRWMETGSVPEGIDPALWEAFFDGGCREGLEDALGPITPTMLGAWARTGSLRGAPT